MLTALLLLGCPDPGGTETSVEDSAELATNPPCTELAWWPDADGDGYGANGSSVQRCEAVAGFASETGDCDDTNPAINPAASEACNLIDDNCDGVKDDANTTWYTDTDGDGQGHDSSATQTCEPPANAVTTGGDCDDTVATTHPGADELCNGIDDDCDGISDLGIESEWYADDDADGYGNPNVHETTCLPETGWVQNAEDCRPGDAEGFPGSAEVCNTFDDNCDGAVDEGFDEDADGHFDLVCSFGDDCDDSAANVYTGAPESCETGVDEDCDGLDPACGFSGDYDLGTDADFEATSATLSYMGYVLLVGDATGDGVDDIFVAATSANGGYLIPGGVSGTVDMDDVGSQHVGDGSEVSGAGRSIGMGDGDGDGLEDIGFGSPYGSAGGMFVTYGPADTFSNIGDDYDAWVSIRYGLYGGHGCDIGDVSGDGIADMIVGAYRADEGGGYGSGAGYVKFGPVAGEYDAETESDAILVGESANGYLGRWAEAGGDHDGDGVGDVMIAAPYVNSGAPAGGTVYIVYGPPSGSIDVASADGQVYSSVASTYLGEGRTFVQGDVNGDGLDDAVVGSTSYTGSKGIMSVLYGPSSGSIDVVSGDIVISGASSSMAFGSGPSAEDADNDGTGDLLIGAQSESGGAGGVYIFWGPVAGSYTTADADAHLKGVSNESAGSSGAWADFNGDGWKDAVVGAYRHDGAGGVYAMFNFQ